MQKCLGLKAMVLLVAAVEAKTCDNGCWSSPQIIMVIDQEHQDNMMIILQMWKQDGELLRQTEMERRWHCGAMCRQNNVISSIMMIIHDFDENYDDDDVEDMGESVLPAARRTTTIITGAKLPGMSLRSLSSSS